MAKGRLLFVLDPVLGHATVRVRGLIFQEPLERLGWSTEFVYLRERGAADDPTALRRREDEIVGRASEADAVYLLKVASLRLVRELKARSDAKVVFDLTDALWLPVHQRAGWRDLNKILRLSDAVFSENEWVCAYGRRFNRRVVPIPPCTQVERFDELRADVRRGDRSTTVVGWIGSSGTM